MIKYLAAQNLDFSYGERQILTDASCEFPIGKVVRLSGPAGAGKSSVLRLLVGLLQPDRGSFLINGLPTSEMSFEEFLPYRLQIGFGFEMGGLLNNRSLYENLALPLQYHRRLAEDGIRDRVQEMLARFNLQRDQNQRPFAVSGSQRKATCVARALVIEPQVLVLDDPTTGLSAVAKIALSDWIKTRLKDQTLRFVLVSTEDHVWSQSLSPLDLEVAQGQLVWRNQEKGVA